MSNPLKKLVSQTAIYGLGSVLPRVITFLYSFILTYIFQQPAELSANTEFYAYISFINIIFTYGMETAFFNFSNDSMKSSPSNTEEPFSMSSDISIEQRSSKEDFV